MSLIAVTSLRYVGLKVIMQGKLGCRKLSNEQKYNSDTTKVIIASIASVALCFSTYLIMDGLKDMVRLSKPGSADESVALRQIETRAHAASKGETQGVKDAIGSPFWWWWSKN